MEGPVSDYRGLPTSARPEAFDRIMPFVSLFRGQGLARRGPITDEACGAKGKVNRIRQSDILRAGHFYTVVDFIDAPEGAAKA